MKRLELIKTLVMNEINAHRDIVYTGCENEMFCFEAYLKERKSVYETMPIEKLEALVRGVIKRFRLN